MIKKTFLNLIKAIKEKKPKKNKKKVVNILKIFNNVKFFYVYLLILLIFVNLSYFYLATKKNFFINLFISIIKLI